MKLISLFSGIGAFEKALDRLKIPYELVAYCEIDKYASKSYAAVHGVSEEKNLGDITKVDEQALAKDIDLVTYGFPCQDISLAGKQKGLFNEDGTQTRSGLFFEALRIIEATQPRVAIAENVKNLTGKKFKEQFQIVLNSLEEAGYNNYWQVLNAKDYGIPQNRERVFIISIRKDIDNGFFHFPEGFPLELRLKDVLESEVDEKYYLDNSKIIKIQNSNFGQEKAMIQFGDVCEALLARDYKDPKCVPVEEPSVKQIANLMPSKTRENPNQGRLYDTDGLSPTLGAMQGGNRQPFVTVREATKKGYAEPVIVEDFYKSREERIYGEYAPSLRADRTGPKVAEPTIAKCIGGIGEKKSNGGTQWYQQDRVYQGDIALAHPANLPGGSYRYALDEPTAYDEQNKYIRKDGCVGTLTTDGSSPKHNNRVIEPTDCQAALRIRKLTPKECWRLMDFDDEDFEKAEAVNSNTQLYKQAGNSIVVSVAYFIFKELLKVGALKEDI